MNNQLTMGSLFDGIGGFMLAAKECGIRPVWAAEIDRSCISITRRHFPEVMHVGSVTALKGDEVPRVDIITFGSPCQNLSISGNRKGLAGEQSGLFLEAVRIIYEMRRSTNGLYPTFIVWENVPGAFSSNNRHDFKTVLEKITKASIPMPESGWARAGMVRGGPVDTAWRTFDAQYWGVPQRRRRIYLVGDFGGRRAGEILFKPEGMLGYPSQGHEKKTKVTGNAGGSAYLENTEIRAAGLHRSGVNKEMIGIDITHADNVIRTFKDITPALLQRMGTGGNQVPLIIEKYYDAQQFARYKETQIAGTLLANQEKMNGSEGIIVKLERHAGREAKYIVRRLTPLECERLQGYPDSWTRFGMDGEKISVTARYRAIGNSIAIPCAVRVFKGIISELQKDE